MTTDPSSSSSPSAGAATATQASTGAKSGYAIAVVRLAAGIDHIIHRGMLRKLQTMDPYDWDKGLVYQLLNQFVYPSLPDLKESTHLSESEDRWAVLMQAMAWCPHSREEGAFSFGSALGNSRFQEANLRNLLRQQPGSQALYDAYLRAIRGIGKARIPLNWISASLVVMTFDERKFEQLRREIARDFYSAVHQRESLAE